MRLVIITAASALVALGAAVIAPATQRTSTRTPPAMLTALFPFRTQQGIDQNCAAAFAKVLTIEQSKYDATTDADRACHAVPGTFPE